MGLMITKDRYPESLEDFMYNSLNMTPIQIGLILLLHSKELVNDEELVTLLGEPHATLSYKKDPWDD